MGTFLLTKHFNSMGVVVPRGTTMEVMKKKSYVVGPFALSVQVEFVG